MERPFGAALIIVLINTIVEVPVHSEKIDFKKIFRTPTKDYDKLEILERSSFEPDDPADGTGHHRHSQPKAVANAQVLFNFDNEKDHPNTHRQPKGHGDYPCGLSLQYGPYYCPQHPYPVYPYHPYFCIPPYHINPNPGMPRGVLAKFDDGDNHKGSCCWSPYWPMMFPVEQNKPAADATKTTKQYPAQKPSSEDLWERPLIQKGLPTGKATPKGVGDKPDYAHELIDIRLSTHQPPIPPAAMHHPTPFDGDGNHKHRPMQQPSVVWEDFLTGKTISESPIGKPESTSELIGNSNTPIGRYAHQFIHGSTRELPHSQLPQQPGYERTDRPLQQAVQHQLHELIRHPTNNPLHHPSWRPSHESTSEPAQSKLSKQDHSVNNPTSIPDRKSTLNPTHPSRGTTTHPSLQPASFQRQPQGSSHESTHKPSDTPFPILRPTDDAANLRHTVCKEMLYVFERMLQYLLSGCNKCTISFNDKDKILVADAVQTIVDHLKKDNYQIGCNYYEWDHSGVLDHILVSFPFSLLLQQSDARRSSQREYVAKYIKEKYSGIEGHKHLEEKLRDKIVDLFLESYDVPLDQLKEILERNKKGKGRGISDAIEDFLVENYWRTSGRYGTHNDIAHLFNKLIAQLKVPKDVSVDGGDDLIDHLVNGMFGAQHNKPGSVTVPNHNWKLPQTILRKVHQLFLCYFAQRLHEKYPRIEGLNDLLMFCRNDFQLSDRGCDCVLLAPTKKADRTPHDVPKSYFDGDFKILTSKQPVGCLNCGQGLPGGKFPKDVDSLITENAKTQGKHETVEQTPCPLCCGNGGCPTCTRYNKELNDF